MKLRNLVFVFGFLFCIQVGAQVTIGSERLALEGALLELTQDGVTTKGLGLPRVRLSAIKPEVGKLAESIGSQSGTEPWNEAHHVGLLIYNVAQEEGCFTNVYYDPPIPGTYVWEGEMWQPLFERKKILDVRTITYNSERTNTDGQTVGSFTMSYTDENNNTETKTYYYASFGVAGTWMTQSLDTKYAPDGTALKNSATRSDVGRGKYNYAYPSNTNPRDATLYNANNNAGVRVGLLYDWYTATNSRNCSTTNQGQVGFLGDNEAKPGGNEVESKESQKYIQGICPEGWHLPSDRECNELEKELNQNGDKYANGTYTVAEKTWDDNWEHTGSQTWRTAITGKVMKSTSQVINTSYILSNADSKPAEDGGFNFHIAGYAGSTNAGAEYSSSYGLYGDFWSSSNATESNTGNQAWERGVQNKYLTTIRLGGGMHTFYSVRCKKDDN